MDTRIVAALLASLVAAGNPAAVAPGSGHPAGGSPIGEVHASAIDPLERVRITFPHTPAPRV